MKRPAPFSPVFRRFGSDKMMSHSFDSRDFTPKRTHRRTGEKMMLSFPRALWISVLCFAVGLPALAQTSLSQVLQPSFKPASASNAPTDALNRTTPSGTVLGFLQAAQNGDNGIAAQYLQMSVAHRQTDGEQLASKLKYVMDNAFAGSLRDVSTQPEGTPQEGVPPGRQKVGTMSAGDVEVDLDLVRVADPSAGKIWLISSDTLTRIPELYEQVQARQVEHKLPRVLVKHQFAGMPLWQWLALLVAVPIAAGAGWLVLVGLEIPLRWWARRRGHADVANWRSVSGPAWLLAGTFIHQAIAYNLRMPLLPRHYYYEVTSVALIVSATWISWRMVRWLLWRVRNRALVRGNTGTGSLMVLGERIIKAAIFVAGVMAVLGRLGFDMSTALAGLGIGGLAIGFGAQKTIENLFGGVSVLGDEVIRVGDVCRFGDRTGTVEDIGLRSTRVRTDERTLLAIPNGTVATINIENLSRRDKILFTTKLGLSSESKSDHVRYLLAEIRRLLYSHARVESNTVRVRLIDIAGTSLTLEVFSYILTRDYNEYAAIREDLLLRMLDIVEDSGSGLALPAQTLYIKRDAGLAKEKADSAVKKIEDLREGKQLPFPNFHEKDIELFRGSIDYPPEESALRPPADDQAKSH
jgi:MscS family membrane protein